MRNITDVSVQQLIPPSIQRSLPVFELSTLSHSNTVDLKSEQRCPLATGSGPCYITFNIIPFKVNLIELNSFEALWLLPKYNVYGEWPASGEIDLVKSRGNQRLMDNGNNIGVEQVSSTLHWGPYFPYYETFIHYISFQMN